PSDGSYVDGGGDETFTIDVSDETSLDTTSGLFFWTFKVR
ncbi:unnamed protein product, partial [marine sediment metagenome]